MKSWHVTSLGFVGTFGYLLSVGAYAVANWPDVVGLKPDAAGDFLAGIFGPIALLWLICGYLQQGIELRQNTRMLELQAAELSNSTRALEHQVEELRRSVEQQSILSRTAQEQVQIDRERHQRELRKEESLIRGEFEIAGFQQFVETAPAIGRITLRNVGPELAILGITSNGNQDKIPSLSSVATGETFVIMPWREGESRPMAKFRIRYKVDHGERGEVLMTVEPSVSGQYQVLLDHAN